MKPWGLASWLALGMAILGTGLAVATGVIFGLMGSTPGLAGESMASGILYASAPVLAAPLGAFIAWRRPAHPAGWLMGSTGLVIGLSAFTQAYAQYGLVMHPGSDLPGAALAAWSGSWLFAFENAPLIMLLLLFPTGALPAPRWRIVVWATLGLSVLTGVAAAIMPGPFPLSETVMSPFDNPTGLAWIPRELLLQILFALFPLMNVLLLAAVVSLILRFRGARGVERQQIKWLMYAAALFLVSQVITVSGIIGRWGEVLANLVSFGMGFAILFAILRYRLFDIDRIINRTLVYGALTLTLGLIYWASVVLLQQVLRPLTQGSDLAIVGSTLAVAALFQPLRGRLQRAVDRRFYRRHYDAGRTLELFTSRLRQEIDLDSLGAELVAVVHRTMQPQRVSLWIRPSGVPRVWRR